jgi:hypothetical protein
MQNSKAYDAEAHRISPRPGFKSFIMTLSFDSGGATQDLLLIMSLSIIATTVPEAVLRGKIGTAGSFVPGFARDTELLRIFDAS